MPRWRELPSSVRALAGGKPAPVLCQARVRVLGFARHTRAEERRASRHRQSGGNRMLGSNMSRLTRRHVLKTGGAVTFAGYAVGVDKVLAQVIKTDTQGIVARSEEHTSELQSLAYLVCRLLLEKKKRQQAENDKIEPILAQL